MNAIRHQLRIYPAAGIAADETPVQRGFPDLPCILCGDAGGNVVVSLDDVSQFHCKECGGDFDADSVRETIDQWQRVLNWLAAAPAVTA
jgi:hypothetical protein